MQQCRPTVGGTPRGPARGPVAAQVGSVSACLCSSLLPPPQAPNPLPQHPGQYQPPLLRHRMPSRCNRLLIRLQTLASASLLHSTPSSLVMLTSVPPLHEHTQCVSLTVAVCLRCRRYRSSCCIWVVSCSAGCTRRSKRCMRWPSRLTSRCTSRLPRTCFLRHCAPLDSGRSHRPHEVGGAGPGLIDEHAP